MLSHLLVISLGSPTDDSDFAARHLIHRFDYVGVDQHVAILLADRSFIAFSVKPRLFQALSPICLYCRLVAWMARQERRFARELHEAAPADRRAAQRGR